MTSVPILAFGVDAWRQCRDEYGADDIEPTPDDPGAEASPRP